MHHTAQQVKVGNTTESQGFKHGTRETPLSTKPCPLRFFTRACATAAGPPSHHRHARLLDGAQVVRVDPGATAPVVPPRLLALHIHIRQLHPFSS